MFLGHMKKIQTITILTSITAVLLFSVGFMQVSNAQITQGTLTINTGCATIIQTQNMNFGTADGGTGTFVQGTFTVRDCGNEAANISVDDITPNNGDWHTSAPVSIILAENTDYFTGSPTGNPFTTGTNLGAILAGAPVVLGTVQPDSLSPGNNDFRVDIETELILTTAFAGALFLDILLVNTGCA